VVRHPCPAAGDRLPNRSRRPTLTCKPGPAGQLHLQVASDGHSNRLYAVQTATIPVGDAAE